MNPFVLSNMPQTALTITTTTCKWATLCTEDCPGATEVKEQAHSNIHKISFYDKSTIKFKILKNKKFPYSQMFVATFFTIQW